MTIYDTIHKKRDAWLTLKKFVIIYLSLNHANLTVDACFNCLNSIGYLHNLFFI